MFPETDIRCELNDYRIFGAMQRVNEFKQINRYVNKINRYVNKINR